MRIGTELKAHDRLVPFSFFPTAEVGHRRPVQSLLFAIDPWLIMKRAVSERIADPNSRREAQSYLEQAEDFFLSASSSTIGAAQPVQLYYSYLNLVKSFVICRGLRPTLSNVQHGIAEKIGAGGSEFVDAELACYRSPNGRGQFQAFDEFIQALGAPRVPDAHRIPMKALLPQILPGHRLWASAAEKRERFVSIQRISFMVNSASKKVWLRLYLFADDIRRLGYSQNDVLTRSGFAVDFKKVKCDEQINGRGLVCFEQKNTRDFTRHGVDQAENLSGTVRDRLWATVGSSTPYRRYYLYLNPIPEAAHLLTQLGSIFSLTHYLGSITRYRPTVFQDILDGEFGPRIAEFVSGQAAQFVYLMASEFAHRDVTKPSIV
ncbi:YaaC family protein [Pseudohalocynthiibacter sp. F2068]|nr:YaaC family protein [Pseudohalocynthiibacter sp. F2068]